MAALGLLLGLGLLELGACATSPALTPEQQRELASWSGEVSRKIQSKRYFPHDPTQARPMTSGTVRVRFTVAENGGIYTPQIVSSSREPLFDAAALAIVLSSAPLPPPPAALVARGEPISLQVPITFIPPDAPRPRL
ncbi:energy transducer TonB [Teichococcus aestuarii]